MHAAAWARGSTGRNFSKLLRGTGVVAAAAAAQALAAHKKINEKKCKTNAETGDDAEDDAT